MTEHRPDAAAATIAGLIKCVLAPAPRRPVEATVRTDAQRRRRQYIFIHRTH